MTSPPSPTESRSTCTAFDGFERIANGTYTEVAIAVAAYVRDAQQSAVLIFDDETGQQIDFDLRGSGADIAARIASRFAPPAPQSPRPPGRPKLGVVAREVTLLPRHWEWLAEQPGGASVTLRKLVEAARQQGPNDRQRLRSQQDRTYRFMSAIAGNLPNFEEATRALFANAMPTLLQMTDGWPKDVQAHMMRLCSLPHRH